MINNKKDGKAMELEKLKSGTDIRGCASDIFGGRVSLTEDAANRLARGFAKYLKRECAAPRIAVGHDTRITAKSLKDAVIGGLVSEGAEVLDCGACTTPAMFMTTVMQNADGAVSITASHHPADRNGLKFFLKTGGISHSQLDEIVKLAENSAGRQKEAGSVRQIDFMKQYSKLLRDKICKGVGAPAESKVLKGMHIVVDAGGGLGGFYAADVLKPLGADISGSRLLEPDGMFSVHAPNPEDSAAMQSISEAVLQSGADLGVIFDTDVDRAACVDKSGREINRNRLIALASAIALKDQKGGTIVTDSVTSAGLKEFIENRLGGRHLRYKRGYNNVISKAKELESEGVSCPLAIETSGHAAMRDNYFLDDGAYLITRIIIQNQQLLKDGKDIDSLLYGLKEPAEERELRFKITYPDYIKVGKSVLDELERFSAGISGWAVAADSYEGVRVSVPGGWFMLRQSVHDPVLPFNIEMDKIGMADKVLNQLKPFFEGLSGIDISVLK